MERRIDVLMDSLMTTIFFFKPMGYQFFEGIVLRSDIEAGAALLYNLFGLA